MMFFYQSQTQEMKENHITTRDVPQRLMEVEDLAIVLI